MTNLISKNSNKFESPLGQVSAGFPSARSAEASKIVASVYGWMGLGVGITAMVGVGTVASGLLQTLMASGSFTFPGLMILQIGLVMVLSFAAPKLSVGAARGLFLAYSALTGLTLSTLMLVYTAASLGGVFIAAAAAFGGLALYGAVTKKNLGFLGTFLFMGLLMVVGLGLVNMFVHSAILYSLGSWMGLLVFSGLTAYDSQRITQMAYGQTQEGSYGMPATVAAGTDKLVIYGALSMYLNFINLFLSLLRIFGNRR